MVICDKNGDAIGKMCLPCANFKELTWLPFHHRSEPVQGPAKSLGPSSVKFHVLKSLPEPSGSVLQTAVPLAINPSGQGLSEFFKA